MKNAHIIDYLDKEAERFTQLAKEHALKNLLDHGNGNHELIAREHLIRAETFKDASRIVAGHN